VAPPSRHSLAFRAHRHRLSAVARKNVRSPAQGNVRNSPSTGFTLDAGNVTIEGFTITQEAHGVATNGAFSCFHVLKDKFLDDKVGVHLNTLLNASGTTTTISGNTFTSDGAGVAIQDDIRIDNAGASNRFSGAHHFRLRRNGREAGNRGADSNPGGLPPGDSEHVFRPRGAGGGSRHACLVGRLAQRVSLQDSGRHGRGRVRGSEFQFFLAKSCKGIRHS
jgi:hypothetical protein